MNVVGFEENLCEIFNIRLFGQKAVAFLVARWKSAENACHQSRKQNSRLVGHSTSRENRIRVGKTRFVFSNQISRLVERSTNRENEIGD